MIAEMSPRWVPGPARVVPDEPDGLRRHTWGMTERGGPVGAIDAYVVELDGVLRGPRRVRADLVTEARDGLTDAAEAYQEAGLTRAHAEREAVAEFGSVPELAASYQRLLAYAQGRRTALLVFCVCAAQAIGSTFAWQTAGMGWQELPSPGFLVAAHVVDWLGIAVKVLALVLLVLCGFGTRWLGTRRWVPRAVGMFALGICVFFAAASVLLTAADPAGSILDVRHLPWIVVGGLAPLFLVLPSARRCFTTT